MIYVESILSFVNYLIFIKNIKHYNNIYHDKNVYIFLNSSKKLLEVSS